MPTPLLWAMAYRCNPAQDTHIVRYREPGHGPRSEFTPDIDSAMLIDATMKSPMPPLALPKREFMENAKVLWEKLGLPKLKPESPWYGYSLGDWTTSGTTRRCARRRATISRTVCAAPSRAGKDIEPNTHVRDRNAGRKPAATDASGPDIGK